MFRKTEISGRVEKNINEMTQEELLEEWKLAVERVNNIWANMPKPYGLWIDWDHRPRRIVITAGIRVDRTIVFPE